MFERYLVNIFTISTRHASFKSRSSRFGPARSSIAGDYHNMPERFMNRLTDFTYIRRPKLPQYEVKTEKYKSNAYYDQWRPWEYQFNQLNRPSVKIRKIYVEPIREWSYFRGDRVEILRGPDKGKQGIINYIVRERNWVFVQSLNLKRERLNGVIRCEEQPLLINHEVKLVDPSDLQPTDFEWRYDDKGDQHRVSIRTERIIPIPSQAFETIDYTERGKYKDTSKDTPAKEANRITFVPEAKTFEMDICEKMGIKDDRVPYPMYWY